MSVFGWGITRFRQAFELVGCVLIALTLDWIVERVRRSRTPERTVQDDDGPRRSAGHAVENVVE
jgi:hypothetical protein